MAVAEAEREMSRNQRGLVDNCFEEGHYESGISVLDKLRSRLYKPSASHIRQLIYLSLYPPPLTKPSLSVSQSKHIEMSPRKASMRRANKDLIPTPEATRMARDALNAFLLTNTPESLIRGIPSYTNSSLSDKPLADDASNESWLGEESLSIMGVKDCWALLTKGFVKQAGVDEDFDTEQDEHAAIGEHSWDTFEWFVGVFEKDQQLSTQSGDLKRSHILLSQIPPDPSGPRKAITAPLNAVFAACTHPIDRHRTQVGFRLMSLLVNLTDAPSAISSGTLVRLTSTHLHDVPFEIFREFLAYLLPVNAGFLVALTCLYIVHNSRGGSSAGFTGGTPSKKRIQATRAKPLVKQASQLSDTLTLSTQSTTPSVYPVPPVERILELLSLQPETHHQEQGSPMAIPSPPTKLPDAALKHAASKFYLLSAIHNLGVAVEADEWQFVAQNGRLKQTIVDGFHVAAVDERDRHIIDDMKSVLLLLIEAWQQEH